METTRERTGATGSSDALAGAGMMIEALGVGHDYRAPGLAPTPALIDTDLRVREGEFVALVGPSGCGKTTLLNAIAGLVMPSRGRITLAAAPVTGIRADVGYMFARDGLMPWRSAIDNVAFGLELRGVAATERRERARKYLALVGLEGFAEHRRGELSQGMRQRVALARTLATEPAVILMDEPFAALDAQTKVIIQDEFLKIWEQFRRTVVFVTHDIVEAVTLADRVIVFSGRPGRIIGEFPVDIPRPRTASGAHDAAFEHLRTEIWTCLRQGMGAP
ncbi:MAG TPA: ABC transporter ATP-binding protein [Burkholderiales bacterium]|jgi:NitT/TauT family transport system ATP-binding protein